MPSDLNLGLIFAAVRLKNEFTPEMQKVVAAAQKAGQEMQAAGRVLTLGITAPLVGAAAAAIKASIDFESSFTGVRKTVNATEPELQALSDGFRELALELPTNVNELNRIGEAAGQLGIQTQNILGFTETMAALGVTTNLSSEEAATSLARLANITGLQQDEFDNLGSSIVALGNNFATTEKEIVDFGLRIAGAGELAGLSEGEILGIGTAMSSIGVQAEAGGTAVQKVLNEINQSVATGDAELRVFAEVAGTTADQFAAAFREDAAGAFESFVTGLGTQGDKSFTVMEDLGLESERVIRAFLGLANAGDLLSDAMVEGNKSFEENIALMIEAEQRYGTTESRLALLWARVRELGITLGDTLIPAVHSFIDLAGPMLTFVTDAVKWWSKWPAPLKLASLAVVALVAAVGPALLIGGTLLTSWATIVTVFPALGTALSAAGLKATGFWVALTGPIGWAIAGLAAAAGAVYYFRDALGLVKPSIEDMGLENARQHVEDLEAQIDGLSSHALRNARTELEKARDGLAELEAAADEAAASVEKLTKDNFPAFAVTLQDAESQLAQAEDGLNKMATAGMVVDAEMENWVDGLKRHVEALKNTETGIEAAKAATAAFTKTIEGQSATLDYWASQLNGVGRSVEPIPPFLSTLTGTIEDQAAALDHWGSQLDGVGIKLDPVPLLLDETEQSAGKLDVTLAALAGQMGGASGQSLNLVTSMIQTNDQLQDGEEGFSKIAIGAAVAGAAFNMLGDAIGGTAGKILSSVGDIATAFATGGPIAGAIAAVGALIGGLKSLFGVSGLEQEGRKAAEAARDAIADTLNDGQMAEAAGNAGNAVHIAIRDAMIASGNSIAIAEAEATRLTRALWMAEKEGGPAVEAVRDQILGLVGASAEAVEATSALADTIASLGDELAQLNRDIRLREIEANIEALETELEAELEIIDARIAGYVALRDAVLERFDAEIEAMEIARDEALAAIDERIEATEALRDLVLGVIDAEIEAINAAKDVALGAIDEQIAAVKELTAARLAAVDQQLAVATGAVVDVSATEGIADRLKIDLSNATVFGAQEASERITALAEDIAALQKAGLTVSAGLSDEFDAELRSAVASAQRFGVTVPESLQTIISTFPDIELGAIAFGDGLTEAARRVKELEEKRDEIQKEANERLAALAIERQETEDGFNVQLQVLSTLREAVEDEFNIRLGELATERENAEIYFNTELETLAELRLEAEGEFVHGLEELMEERQGIEELFAGAIAVLTIERETIEDSMVESIDDMRIRRVQVEGELNAAISLAASNVAAAAAKAAPPVYSGNPADYGYPGTGYGYDGSVYGGGFASGTGGRFMDFGRSSTIQVHGKERIVTEAEGRREAETDAASLRGVEDKLDRLDKNLQRAIKRISTDVTNAVMTKSL